MEKQAERTINIREWFYSIDGEVNLYGQGTQATFVRLSGCNLRCPYCDTVEAQESRPADQFYVDTIAKVISKSPIKKLTITGGEPLLQQEELLMFVAQLVKIDYRFLNRITVETNGTVPISRGLRELVDCFVVDYKIDNPPLLEVLMAMNASDWMKFVVWDRCSYEKAKSMYLEIIKNMGLKIAFSPVLKTLPAKQLLDWLMEDRLRDIVLNVQIHKLIDVK